MSNLRTHLLPRLVPTALLQAGLLVVVLGTSSCTPALDPGRPTLIRLDGSTRHQTIDGWAVYPRYWEEDKSRNRFNGSFEPFIAAASDALVNQVGINAVRLELPSGAENPTDRWTPFYSGSMTYSDWAQRRYEKINDNADPRAANLAGFRFEMFDYRYERMVLPIKRALEARGEKMHVTLCYVDFKWNANTVQGPLSHADRPEEYAELLLVYVEHLRDKYGITPDAVEIVLEPNNTEKWRGPHLGRALVAASDRLAENGIRPEFIGPSDSSTHRAIRDFQSMIRIPGVAERLHTFSYHRYGESTSDVERIRARAQARGLKTAMLEKVGAGIDVLFEDLIVGQVSSWQQWAVADATYQRDDGGFYLRIDPISPADTPRISMAKHAAQLSQVFRFVRRGAVRIDASSDNPDKRALAFINTDGHWVAVVRGKTAGGRLNLEGLPPGVYGMRGVNEARVSADLSPVTVHSDGILAAELPEAGVLTFHQLPSGPPSQ